MGIMVGFETPVLLSSSTASFDPERGRLLPSPMNGG